MTISTIINRYSSLAKFSARSLSIAAILASIGSPEATAQVYTNRAAWEADAILLASTSELWVEEFETSFITPHILPYTSDHGWNFESAGLLGIITRGSGWINGSREAWIRSSDFPIVVTLPSGNSSRAFAFDFNVGDASWKIQVGGSTYPLPGGASNLTNGFFGYISPTPLTEFTLVPLTGAVSRSLTLDRLTYFGYQAPDDHCDFYGGDLHGATPCLSGAGVMLSVQTPGPSGNANDPYLCVEGGMGGSGVCLPSPLAGDWSGFSGCTALCFDVRVIEDACTPAIPECVSNGYLAIEPWLTITDGTLSAIFRAYSTVTDDAGPDSGWHSFCAPLRPVQFGILPNNTDGYWEMQNGATNAQWDTLLQNVVSIELPTGFNGFDGEVTGWDNLHIGQIPGCGDPNDTCSDAIHIPSEGPQPFDNGNATSDGADFGLYCDVGPFGDDLIYNDVWFTYTPTQSGCTYISTVGLAGFDTRLAIYDSVSCPDDPSTVLACSDDEVSAPPYEAGFDVELLAGHSYLIRIGSYSANTVGGSGTLLLEPGPMAFANDGGLQPGAPGCAPSQNFPDVCVGNGGNQTGCTNCPCGNNAPSGTIGGCLNSAGSSARILASGVPSISLSSGSTSDLRFALTGAPATAFCILNSGDAVAPGNMASPCFGLSSGSQAAAFDGLRCAIVNTRRHGGRSADANGDVGVTNSPWGGEGGPPAGIANAGGGLVAGQTRFFQIINRDDPLLVCTRGLNTSQAVEITFTP